MDEQATRKVVPFVAPEGYVPAESHIGREVGQGAEIVPVNFRRQDHVKLVQGAPIMFAFIPSEKPESVDLIITVPQWVYELIASVGLKPEKEYPGGGVD